MNLKEVEEEAMLRFGDRYGPTAVAFANAFEQRLGWLGEKSGECRPGNERGFTPRAARLLFRVLYTDFDYARLPSGWTPEEVNFVTIVAEAYFDLAARSGILITIPLDSEVYASVFRFAIDKAVPAEVTDDEPDQETK